MTTRVSVPLSGGRAYDIVIGAGALSALEAACRTQFAGRRFLTLCDPAAQTHLPAFLKENLRVTGRGEGVKTWESLGETMSWILAQKPERKTIIVAFGGGVVGDHAGFAAAIALRGLDFIQVPTTLLAQVDSSVGGKTGINAEAGKNLIGAFHQPLLVAADTATLATLPAREMRAGYAEIVKYGFLGDPAFFDWLEAHGEDVLARNEDALVHAIATSCRAKAAIVAADEREGGVRALLNFGHTFAHALEAACGFDDRLAHGEAVAVGMALAFDVSRRMGLCPEQDAARACAHMRRMGLPVAISDIAGFPALDAQALIGLMAGDKKAAGGRLTFILARGIGSAFATQDADMSAVADALTQSAKG
ncbi:MAG: 3-dehydroquinate synthase [Rhodospirillales bacterium]|nr:3-dehydroquinate synthase [Alphaproteobacteria bacterium]MCB9986089.1 3-dehydroquinate synthase [Rhodospirillales bacterium]USO08631.1 MAG: 3-dehydroquinate synthase [Rhodospirillales bacterium]